jgi:hypothetical protein
VWSTAFRSLTTEISLSTDELSLVEILEGLTASYGPPGDGPKVSYELRTRPAAHLLRDGRLIYVAETVEDLPPLFELDLYQLMASRQHEGCLLHSACLSTERGAILLVGPSGSGKSTLALSLLRRCDCCYLTDEWVRVSRDGTVRGLTRPITFGEALDPAEIPSDFSVVSAPFRSRAGGLSRATLVHPPRHRLCYEAPRCQSVALVRYEPLSPSAAKRLSRGEALCALWPHALYPAPESLEALVALIDRCDSYEVNACNIAEASELLLKLWDEAR